MYARVTRAHIRAFVFDKYVIHTDMTSGRGGSIARRLVDKGSQPTVECVLLQQLL
jgi:hypothetical protein